MVLGVRSQFPCKAPEGRDEVEGNLCSDPENARVSGIPFVLRYRRIGPGFPPVRAEPVEALRWITVRVLQKVPVPLCRRGGRPTILLLRQKKVGKEKATRSPGPCASLRAPCGARFKRGHAQTRLRLKQVRALIRSKLRSSAQPGRVGEVDSNSGSIEPASQAQ